MIITPSAESIKKEHVPGIAQGRFERAAHSVRDIPVFVIQLGFSEEGLHYIILHCQRTREHLYKILASVFEKRSGLSPSVQDVVLSSFDIS